MSTQNFSATIELIGVNPFVSVPPEILQEVFRQAQKNKGAIRVRGSVNGLAYRQSLVKYAGQWRLYINTAMLKNSPRRIGENIEVTIEYDPEVRELATPEAFRAALDSDEQARKAFEALAPSRRSEIVRYLAHLKSEDALNRNIQRVLDSLS